MKRVYFRNNPDRHLFQKLPALLLAVLVTLSACSGSNNTSSTPIPLPNGQNGSLTPSNLHPADCYAITTATSLTICSSSPPAYGTNGVTALNTFVSSSLPGLVVGTNNGVVSIVPNVNSTSIIVSCTYLTNPISAVAVAGTNIFAAVGSTLYEWIGTSSCNTTSAAPPTSSITIGSGITGLAVTTNDTLFGVTSAGSYFSIANASSASPSLTQSLTPLPNYPVSGPVINGMAIDPNGLVFFADASTNTANNGGQITIYHVSSTGTTISPNNVQSYSGDNNGVAISAPIGIAVSETSITNSNYCSTSPCDYIYLLNSGNIIQQYVMPVPSPITGGVSINPFNLPYTGCEMTDPVALASFPALNTSPTTPPAGPFVFLGNTTKQSFQSCDSANPYGNNVVSYGITGQ